MADHPLTQCSGYREYFVEEAIVRYLRSRRKYHSCHSWLQCRRVVRGDVYQGWKVYTAVSELLLFSDPTSHLDLSSCWFYHHLLRNLIGCDLSTCTRTHTQRPICTHTQGIQNILCTCATLDWAIITSHQESHSGLWTGLHDSVSLFL